MGVGKKLAQESNQNLCSKEEHDEREIEGDWPHAQRWNKSTDKTQWFIGNHVNNFSKGHDDSAWSP